MNARALAFYLPQYFPIPENDEWWGPGFTEWTNVAKAKPLFRGHQQPDLPGELGFYDLRVPETRLAQSNLAQEYGVEAFVYWHYWFGDGDTILERPFREVLSSGSPDISFCLAWANQTWSGIWHGATDKILKEQRYLGESDEKAHFESVFPAFLDPRYLRVGGKPVFYVFRPEELPDAASFIAHWRRLAAEAGLPGLYFVAEVSDLLGAGPKYDRVVEDGFDSGVYMRLPVRVVGRTRLAMRLRRKLRGGPEVWPYDESVGGPLPRHLQPCVYPNWDNTPRSGRRGLVARGSSPRRFAEAVKRAVGKLDNRPVEERLLWVKSWNEWAEGNHLEPDATHERAWLEALRSGLASDG